MNQGVGVNATSRVHYMDNLRALAMLAGVVFHAALAYSVLLHPYWPAADAQHSRVVDGLVWFLHLFRMPLFFVVAGYFAAMLVSRRGMAGFFRQRIRRILVPLLLFVLPIGWSLHRLTMHAMDTVQNPSPMLRWLRGVAAEQGSLPMAPSLAHLWFLHYLMLFALLVWIVATLDPKWLRTRLATVSPSLVPWAMPLLMVPALASVTVPWPAPESPLPAMWAMVYFGLHFALGFQVWQRPALLDGLRRHAPWLALGGLLLYLALLWSMRSTSYPLAPGRQWLNAALESYAGFWMTLACLLAGKAWLDRSNAVLRWLSDSSYWVYLVHLPLLFAIQYPLLDVAWHWSLKLALAVSVTFALAFASYQWLVRPTMLGRLLAPGAGTGRGLEVAPRSQHPG